MTKLLNKQQIFEKVMERLLDGTGRSQTDPGHACLYINNKGLNCAVGIFIDEKHLGLIKGTSTNHSSIHILLEKYPDALSTLDRSEFESDEDFQKYMRYLQRLHDMDVNWNGNDFLLSSCFYAQSALTHLRRVFGIDVSAYKTDMHK